MALLGELGRERAAALVVRAPVPMTPDVRAAADAAGVAAARAEPRRPVGASRGDAPLAAGRRGRRRRRAGVARRAALGRPVRGRQRDRLPARRADHHRGPQLSGAGLLRATGRGRPVEGRDDPRPPGAGALLADAPRSRCLPRAATAATSRCSSSPTRRADGFTMPRVAIAVRAGDEVLGSIWAAVPGPLSDERTEALRDSAKLVALHLLRVRAGADVHRRLRADLLSSALEGGAGASEALERLGLAGQPLLVLGVALDERGRQLGDLEGASVAHERQRLSDAFALHLAPCTLGLRRPRSATSPTGSCPSPGRPTRPRQRRCGSPRTSWTGWATGSSRSPRSARSHRTSPGWPRAGRRSTALSACSATDAPTGGSAASTSCRARP